MKQKSIENKIAEMIKKAITELPREVVVSLREAHSRETNGTASPQLKKYSRERLPCTKTLAAHMPRRRDAYFLFNTWKNRIRGEIERAIHGAVKKVTKLSLLCSNAVRCISRENTGSNLGSYLPIINWGFSDKNTLK